MTEFTTNSFSVGIQPDIILGRANVPLDQKRKEKIQFMCGLEEGDVVSAPNVESIYEVPINFEKDNISSRIFKKLALKPKKRDLREWKEFTDKIKNPKGEVKIGIVGKYFGSGDFILTGEWFNSSSIFFISFHSSGVYLFVSRLAFFS